MSEAVPRDKAEQLARALAGSGVAFDPETGAGLVAIGVSLLRAAGLGLDDVEALVRLFYDAAPDVARRSLEGEGEG